MFGQEKKRRRRLEAAFGKRPDVYFTGGDMERIRAWSDYRREREDGYSVDDVTWHDLDMDRVFRRIDPGLSTPGEQVLYDTLRHPALTGEEYGRRARLIAFMEARPEKRLEVQAVLDRLGRTRRSDLCTAFAPEAGGRSLFGIYVTLSIAFVASLVLGVLGVIPIMAAILLMSFNMALREFMLRRVRREFDTLNYSVAEVFALRRVQRLGAPDLDRELAGAYEALKKLRFVLHTGGISGMDTGNVGDLLASLLLLDLITYEYLKNKLWAHQKDLMAVIEGLGRLDTAIAAASWRAGMDVYAVPDIAFDGSAQLHIRGMVHPLLDAAVPNDLDLGGPMLLTGSNASGKSTYLRTALLNVLLAQSLCTAAAESYQGGVFTLYSSMALEDDLLAGESYYVTEIKSIRRILTAAERERPVLCVVDEVLRGTNTAERIAASSAILETLFDAGVLCLAATHDLELCALLAGKCRMCHFAETVGEDSMRFDYRLREGPARSRNAIRLLGLMGFDAALVDKAERRAKRYLETGAWE